jgi:hypothetical protein
MIAFSCRNIRKSQDGWPIGASDFKAIITEENNRVIFSKGLVTTTVSIKPVGATTGFKNNITGPNRCGL